MDDNYVWATDVEIVAVSKILGVDLFVANYHFDKKKLGEKVDGLAIILTANFYTGKYILNKF